MLYRPWEQPSYKLHWLLSQFILRNLLSLPEDVLEPIAAAFGGGGGGHTTAGVAQLDTTDLNTVETAVVEHIEDALGVQFGSFT